MPFGRTVALTLGTVFTGAHDVLDAALAGLRTLQVNVIVITGPGSDPARLGPQPGHVLVQPYLPYALPLPRIDLLVSQAGAGGLFGALGHGLPQLLLPQGAEQFGNAQACARAGAALVLDSRPVRANEVADSARRLLDDQQFARAANAVRRQMLAMPDAAALLPALLSGD